MQIEPEPPVRDSTNRYQSRLMPFPPSGVRSCCIAAFCVVVVVAAFPTRVWLSAAAQTPTQHHATATGKREAADARGVIVRFAFDSIGAPLPLASRSRGVVAALGSLSESWMQGRFALVTLRSDVDVDEAVAALQTLPEVDYAVPDQSIILDAYVPNDPQFAAQWGLDNPTNV